MSSVSSGIKRPIISPLRYPGGKASLYQPLRDLIRVNNLTSGTYVEPYAGGAGAALALLITGQVRKIVINDLDPAIFAFWQAVVNEPNQFARLIGKAELTLYEWARQKDVFLSAARDDYLRLGFATFYLNRTNRSGALNGGVIGGKKQTGNYTIDARFNKVTLMERVRLISLYSRNISVTNDDGLAVIKRYAPSENVFIYADPPYFDKAGSLYLNSFEDTDHVALASCLNGLSDVKWLLTYDNVNKVQELYADRRRKLFSLHYSAHRVTKAEEVMVFSDAMMADPASVTLF